MPISPARAAAFDILLRVERQSSYASELLHSRAHERLSTQDHALATELVMGVLRWRSRLDDEIAKQSSQPIGKIDLEVLLALRIALYQFRWLDRIPQRAALHESVELVKRARKRSAAAFVNAVLRKLSPGPSVSSLEDCHPDRSASLSEANHRTSGFSSSVVSGSSPQAIAESSSHPLWLVERWTKHYGLETARKIAGHDQSIPATSIRLRTPEAESELASEGVSLEPGNLLSSARIVTVGEVTKTNAFRKTAIVIQDEASQLVAALVGQGARILDCCAAPGGKTLALADHNPEATITAVELHPHRARLLQKLLANSKQEIRVVAAAAQALPLSASFDRVLADVPCSGTGTLARNPEIKWRLKPEDLIVLQQRQLAILRAALVQLAPKGRLIYSTCSLEKEENEDVIDLALRETDSFRIVDCRAELARLKSDGALIWPDPGSLTAGPYLRTIPGVHPSDGFFAAILERKS